MWKKPLLPKNDSNKQERQDEIEEETEQFMEGRVDASEEEINSFKDELEQRRDTVVMRKYRIDMQKYFENFKPNDLISGQPFNGEVFDWGIMEKK